MRTVLATLTLALGASIAPAQFGAPAPPPGGGFPAVPTTPAQSPYHTPYAGVRPCTLRSLVAAHEPMPRCGRAGPAVAETTDACASVWTRGG